MPFPTCLTKGEIYGIYVIVHPPDVPKDEIYAVIDGSHPVESPQGWNISEGVYFTINIEKREVIKEDQHTEFSHEG